MGVFRFISINNILSIYMKEFILLGSRFLKKIKLRASHILKFHLLNSETMLSKDIVQDTHGYY